MEQLLPARNGAASRSRDAVQTRPHHSSVSKCIVTMPGTLTLTAPWKAGIEKNTYLAYVFAIRAGYVVAARLLTTATNVTYGFLAAAEVQPGSGPCEPCLFFTSGCE